MQSKSLFSALYKAQGKRFDSQEDRRKKLLKEQKQRRLLSQDEFRTTNKRNMRKAYWTYKKKYNATHSLQISEWLYERPTSLDDWFLVPCPKGQRCMIVSCDRVTEMFSKNGRFIKRFRTLLPGDGCCGNEMTILDCVFVEKLMTFFVLDALSYGNQDLLECEAQFRFFWLKSKLIENNLDQVGPQNEYIFKSLSVYNCEIASELSECLQKFPHWSDNTPEVDGLLFYHKEASYTCGTTPLVGWLFPFMVPEVLNLRVNYQYEKPKDYVDYLHYIREFDEFMANKNRNRRKKQIVSNVNEDEFTAMVDSQQALEIGMYDFVEPDKNQNDDRISIDD